MNGKEGKYLTFTLGDEEYGISIAKVREIIGLMKVTAVPQSPASVTGVVNLRDRVIPVVDLRSRFGMAATTNTQRTCIIIIEVRSNDNSLIPVGVIVDAVSEVLLVKADNIEEPPSFAGSTEQAFIMGMAKANDQIITLLDTDCLFSFTEQLTLPAKAA